MRKLMKTIAKSDFSHQMVAHLIKWYIKFVYYTSSWKSVKIENLEHLINNKKPFVACFWHGRLAMIPQIWQWNTPLTALVSAHGDGVLVGRVFQLFGVDCIKGSTNRGGTTALLKIITTLKKGTPVGLTPDGPRGPREIVNPGIILMAKAGKAPLIPISYAVRRYKVLNTWDHFMLPYPFNKGVFLVGDPIDVPEDADDEMLEAYRLKLEAQLNLIQKQADELVKS